jgi:predicted RNA binding protein YcfA (HicA-like mRNA interferase family)
MLIDEKPISYTYEEAASVLANLGFELAPSSGGSHRKWRALSSERNVVVVGLVDSGSGTLKAYLIRDMVAQLREHGFITEPEKGS